MWDLDLTINGTSSLLTEKIVLPNELDVRNIGVNFGVEGIVPYYLLHLIEPGVRVPRFTRDPNVPEGLVQDDDYLHTIRTAYIAKELGSDVFSTEVGNVLAIIMIIHDIGEIVYRLAHDPDTFGRIAKSGDKSSLAKAGDKELANKIAANEEKLTKLYIPRQLHCLYDGFERGSDFLSGRNEFAELDTFGKLGILGKLIDFADGQIILHQSSSIAARQGHQVPTDLSLGFVFERARLYQESLQTRDDSLLRIGSNFLQNILKTVIGLWGCVPVNPTPKPILDAR